PNPIFTAVVPQVLSFEGNVEGFLTEHVLPGYPHIRKVEDSINATSFHGEAQVSIGVVISIQGHRVPLPCYKGLIAQGEPISLAWCDFRPHAPPALVGKIR